VARGSPLPCADYAALPELRQADEKLGPHSSHHNSPPTRSQSPSPAASTDGVPPAYLLPPPVRPPEVKLDHTAHLCCSRPSPLVCPNQPLCDALDVLRRGRALESNELSALSYGRAIAVSVILPSFHSLCSQLVGLVGYQRCSCMHLMLSARPLTGVTVISVPAKNYGQGAWGGTEIAIYWREGFQDGGLRTTEYISIPLLTSGRSTNTSSMAISPKLVCALCIPYSPYAIQTEPFLTETMRESERFKALSLFNTIYGIGPATARTLYGRGLRSLRDLEAYYEADTGSTPVENLNSESTDLNIRIALGLRGDLMRTCESLARNRAAIFVLTHIQHTAQRS
jgi:Fingers domain of DNA polymerase lambda